MNTYSLSVTRYGNQGFKLFDYCNDNALSLHQGSLVKIPFGKQSTLGIVIKEASDYQGKNRLLSVQELIMEKPLPSYLVLLAEWLVTYYQSTPAAVWRTILPSGITQRSRLKPPIELGQEPPQIKRVLNPAQKQAVATITKGSYRGYLLHGITGSGKTEVYIELMRKQLASGKSCLLLVPEISLTPQMVERIAQHFPDQLIVNHSKLTPAKRKQAWLALLHSTVPHIVIGPRSSLFLPFANLGLVIVDEEHEQSYKQENSPTYNTNQVVAKLCELTDAHYVLGSATPSLITYTMAQSDKLGYVVLNERAGLGNLPEVTVIDQRDKHDLLSPELVKAMQATLQSGNQVLLFLNRRGSAGSMVCHHCGNSIRCPRCEMSLTFHADSARLICHYCGFRTLPPTTCPHCHKTDLAFVGSGTKKVETEIRRRFADYHTARLDSDNADLDYIKEVYQALKDRSLDIIIGTQMIARGLDLAGIGLVGVVATENMLAIPDYSSSERTFQLLTQVAGRSGRADSEGQVIIQTLSPGHPAVMAASHHDFTQFYNHEIELRQRYAYPPFTYLVKLMYGHKTEAKAITESEAVANALKEQWPLVQVLGPTERALRRSGGLYWRQIIVKAKRRKTLLEIVATLKPGWKHDIDPLAIN